MQCPPWYVLTMKRRGFLGILAALPFVPAVARLAKAVKRRLFRTVYVGSGATGEGTADTIHDAMSKVEPGGTIVLLPGHAETVEIPVSAPGGLTIIGHRPYRATFTWKPKA